MTISRSVTDAEWTVTPMSPQPQQRSQTREQSPPAALQPQKSHQPRRHRQQPRHAPQTLYVALPTSDVIPEGQASCVRFYKGRSGRERRQHGPAVVAVATAVASARRARKRGAKRRPRSQMPAGDRERHNCDQSDDPQDISPFTSYVEIKKCAKPEAAPPVFDHHMLTRLRNRTSTTDDTQTSCTVGSTASSILRSQDNDMIDTDPYKMQYIYHGGRLRAVQVMKWPEKLRIPTSERYRHEEPMKRRYGRKSLLCRLVRGLELSSTQEGPAKSSDFRRPIPLLPKRMIETTKSRLLNWYKPLDSSGEFHGTAVTEE